MYDSPFTRRRVVVTMTRGDGSLRRSTDYRSEAPMPTGGEGEQIVQPQARALAPSWDDWKTYRLVRPGAHPERQPG